MDIPTLTITPSQNRDATVDEDSSYSSDSEERMQLTYEQSAFRDKREESKKADRSLFKPELWNYTSRVQEISHMTRELKHKRVEAKSKVTGELRMIYKATTSGGTRDMMKKEFGNLCKKFFPQIPQEVQEDWFDVFDSNGDGIIDFDEFKHGVMKDKSVAILKKYAPKYYKKIHEMKATLVQATSDHESMTRKPLESSTLAKPDFIDGKSTSRLFNVTSGGARPQLGDDVSSWQNYQQIDLDDNEEEDDMEEFEQSALRELMEEVEMLYVEKEELEEELAAVRAELEEAQETIKRGTEMFAESQQDKEREISELMERLDSERKRVEEMAERRNQDLEERSDKLNDAQQRYTDLMDRYEGKALEIGDLRSTIGQLELQNQRAMNDSSRVLEETEKRLNAEITKLQAQVEDRAEIQEKMVNALNELAQMEAKSQTLESAKAELEQALEELKESSMKAEEALLARATAAEGENSDMSATNKTLGTKLGDLETKQIELEQKLLETSSELSETSSQRDELQSQLETMTDQSAKTSSKLEETAETLKERTDALEKCEAEFAECKSKLEASTQSVESLKETITNLTSQNDDKLGEMQEKYSMTSSALIECEEMLKIAEDRVLGLTENVEKLKAEVEGLAPYPGKLEEVEDKLRKQLEVGKRVGEGLDVMFSKFQEESETRAQTMEGRIQQSLSQLQMLSRKLTSTQDDLNQAQKELKDMTMNYEQTVAALEQSKADLTADRETLASTQTQLENMNGLYEDARQKIDLGVEERAALEAELSQLRETLEGERENVNHLEQNKIELETKMQQLELSKSALEEDLMKKSTDYSELEEQYGILESENAKAQEGLDQGASEKQNLEERLQNMEIALEDVKQKLLVKEQQFELLEEDNRKMTEDSAKQGDELSQEIAKLRQEAKEKALEIVDLNDQLTREKAENSRAQLEIVKTHGAKELETALKQNFEKRIKELEQGLSEMKSKCNLLEVENDSLKKDLRSGKVQSEGEVKKLQQQIKMMNQQQEFTASTQDAANQAQTSAQMENLQLQLNSVKMEKVEKEMLLRQSNERLQKLEQRQQRRDGRNDKKKQKIKTLRKVIYSCAQHIKDSSEFLYKHHTRAEAQRKSTESVAFVKELSNYIIATRDLVSEDVDNVNFTHLERDYMKGRTGGDLWGNEQYRTQFEKQANSMLLSFLKYYSDAGQWLLQDVGRPLITLDFEGTKLAFDFDIVVCIFQLLASLSKYKTPGDFSNLGNCAPRQCIRILAVDCAAMHQKVRDLKVDLIPRVTMYTILHDTFLYFKHQP